MKHLILVRHAKSSWKDSDLEDHDRPLNKRGERDAPAMAKIFHEKNMPVDLIAASTALRTLTTAREFAKKLDYKKDEILRVSELYLAEADDLMEYITNLDDDHQSVMLVGHNNGITWFANALTDGGIENIPTSGIAAIDLDIQSWKEAKAGCGKLRFFEFPKKHFKDAAE